MTTQIFKSNRVIVLDEWQAIGWDEFVQLRESSDYQTCKAYYHNHKMRLETMPVGSDHAKEHLTLIMVIVLFGICRNLALDGRDNCTFRKVGHEEFQPDIAYYVGEQANQLPQGIRIVDLDRFPLPDLVIEVADTSLDDDLGTKQLQYMDLRIKEYWVWDVQSEKLLGFAIASDGTSREIRVSEVLPGLEFDLVETAIQRCWESNQSVVGQWLMQQWQRPA